MKRSRGRGRRQQNPVNRSYDSNGPDVRVRGTASQVYEKYQALARDAMASGDRVMAENYGQHAEHYYRIMLSLQPAPSEADKETANGDGTHGEALHGDEANGTANGEGPGEPLVLVREGDEADDKPAKPSRRRGPLRKKKAEASESHEASEAQEGEAQVELVADTPDAPEGAEAEIASAE